MSYFPIQGSRSALFWAYNSTAQIGVIKGQYFEVDVTHEITGNVSGGVVLDAVSLVYGELQTSGTSGQVDRIKTAFTRNSQASGEGWQLQTNKTDSYDCDDGTYSKSSTTGAQFLQYKDAQNTSTQFSAGVDQTRIFGFRVAQ